MKNISFFSKTIFALSLIVCLSANNIFAQNFSYNQNEQVKKELVNGSTYKDYDGNPYKLEMIELNYKDLTGNTPYLLMFKSVKDTLYFCPDNPYYPLTYVKIKTNWGGKHHKTEDNYVIFNKNLGAVWIYTDNIQSNQPKVIGIIAGDHLEETFGIGMYKNDRKKSGILFNKTVGNTIKGRFAGLGTITTTNDYAGLSEFYKYRKIYLNSILNYQHKGYKKELSNTLPDGEYYVYYKSSSHSASSLGVDGKIRIKQIKNSEGGLEKLVMQIPYTDGVFYDKEKFFFTLAENQNTKFFNYQNKPDSRLIPFQGKVLITSDNYNILGVISPEKKDGYALQLLNSKFGLEQSHNFWCKEELEENYDEKKDKYTWNNVFLPYVDAMMKSK